jgi:pyruvate kinase
MQQTNHFLGDIRTKFICTLGPASSNKETMRELIKAGACIFRNNFAHAQYDEYNQRLQWLNELNEELGTSVQMQADIQGTNIRVGTFPEGKIEIEAGKEYVFVTNGEELLEGELPINDDTLHEHVKVGERFTLMDGALESIITAVDGHRITVKMENGGILKNRKSINVPETDLPGSSVTEKDKKDLDFLINHSHVDWLALSFVGRASDIEEVRAMIGDKKIFLMSKIERKFAIDNLPEIVAASDALMIARGDLGIEVPAEEVPIIGKQMIALAHQQHKPVVTATQMMLSMAQGPRPTRAEVSDVANAIFDRSDAVMLSEETADGVNPVLALEAMVKVVRRTEEYIYGRPNNFEKFGL